MLLIAGFLFMLFLFVIAGILSGALDIFIDLPSALLIIIPLSFLLSTTKSGRIFGRYITTSFKKNHEYTAAELESLRAAAKNTVKFNLSVGVFGFFMGLIACLAYLGSLERLGPNLAISLLTLTYSIAVSYFVFFPVQVWAENKINTLKER